MENTTEKSIDVLNDLVKTNNDRIEGYEKAIDLLSEDEDLPEDYTGLKSLFENYRDQSLQFNATLKPLVAQLGGAPAEEASTTGKIFRLWMDIKASLPGSNRQAILNSCERGEDEFIKAYKKAINHPELLDPEIVNIISSQIDTQLEAHDRIKALRDGEI